MIKWLFFGFIVFLVYRFALQGRPKYVNVVSPEHLRELSRGLNGALRAAVEQMGKDAPVLTLAEGNWFMTSPRVSFFYSITPAENGGFEHKISMASDGRRPLGKAIAGFLAAGVARLLGHVGARGVFAESTTGTFHFIVPFSASDHAKLVQQGIAPLDESSAQKMFEVAMEDRDFLVKKMGRIEIKGQKR